MRRVIVLMLALAAVSSAALAQDFRGAITGRITDSSNARMPGVTVVATNVETNVAQTTVTNSEGDYTVLYLNPGTYTVTAELSGFKKLARNNLQVRVGEKLGVDFTLEVGAMAETVQVSAEAPVLTTTSGSTGQTISEKTIAMMPLSDGNPFALARLAPGIAYNGDLKFSRPFDNAGTSGIVTGGAPGGNEFSLDGSPNMANGRRVAFVPPAGAVQEFKVETASFDAGSGHTAGATVNVTLKSGTNNLKGSAYTYYRSDKLAETDFFIKKNNAEKPELGYNRPGFTLGGPIVHDKTFFFAAVEWLYDRFPEPLSQTVPTEAMRNGDFSALLAQGIQLYDPLSAQISTGTSVVRQPFPGNVIPPNRINPIAQKVLSYYPLPNQPGDAGGRNNFFYENPRTDDFYSVSTRFDHAIGNNQRLMGRYTRNDRRESRNAQLGTVNGIVPTGNFLFRKNDGVTVDHTWTQNNTSVWEFRGGWQRFREPNVRQHEGLFDPASLGFSPSVTALFGGASYFPFFDFDTLSDIGDNLAGNTTHTIYSFQPTYTKLVGDHSVRAGYDLRNYREFGANPGRQAGEYVMRNANAFTRQTNSAAAQNFQDLATFLTGFPTAGTIDINADRNNYQWYHALFVQDDWKLTSKLTLNLGVRYDYEGPPTEQNNANTRGFDPAAILSLTAAAEAAYAARPDVIPPSQWHARGGLGFASGDTPGIYNPDRNNIQPRVGFAYRWNEKTVIRGGWGLYTSPFVFSNGINQMGYSQSTPFTASQNNGLTFLSTLSNPYPSGTLQPVGNSLGPNTFLGQSFSTSPTRVAPVDFQNPQLSRYLVNVQRELPAQWLLEVGYAGSHGYNLTTNEELNAIPAQYLSSSQVRDQPNVDFLAALVANPFAGGLLPTGFTAATVARSQLLRPFPQFNNVPIYGDEGTSQYDSAQMKIEKRFTHGYSIIGTYTFSHFTDRVFRLNPTDPGFENRLARDDVPHRVTTSLLYELPFGHGHAWGGNASGLVNGLIGGWSVNAIGQFQSGRPLDFESRNIYFNGDLNALKAKYTSDSDAPVFDISGFYFHDALVQTNGVDDPVKQRADTRIRLANNLRYFPSRVDGLRSPFLKLWDISIVKQVPLSGRMRAQFNIEFLNAFNVVVFNDANTDPTNADFGKVTSQNNLPRDIQLAAKIVW
ncbi:MAG TPA: carboxypeptidase regulatory-like domain-containing protein [Vicinamibacterales bacterium]|nr:carboxypeptidase regulatory-like domain-containing protein [Vicinamibacterales bacterium]